MTLYALFLIAALNHAAKTGSNVTILLMALHLDASPVLVGALTALAGLLPMLLAVSVGRLNDRFGARLPLFAGSVIVISMLLLPAIWPGLPALFVTAGLAGVGSTMVGVSTQSVVGLFGRHEDRTRNFSWLSIAFSAGAVVGPLLAGRLIDLISHEGAFLALACLPVLAVLGVGSGRLAFPPPRAGRAGGGAQVTPVHAKDVPAKDVPANGVPAKGAPAKGAKRAFDLLREPELRYVYLLTALHVSAWEVFSFLVPVYGAGIGLPATSIGVILGTFATATFFVRILMPWFANRFSALFLIRMSLVLAGGLFVLFPLAHSVLVLSGLAFILGMGLGVTQPLAMAVLHESAPDGRTGEAVGLRTAVVNLSAATTPLIYGALGSALGMTPVFWGLAVALWATLWALGRPAARTRSQR